MCGIVGIFNKEDAFSQVAFALDILKARGKDGVGACDNNTCTYAKSIEELKGISSTNLLGHALHSVVSFVPQPIKKKGTIAANCEIYNWAELKKKYSLNSGNDSELILDLIELKGISKIKEILDELDGVYSFAYWVSNKVYLARDILGEKPLWYSLGKSFAFASEKKALEKLGYHDAEELNPRVLLTYDLSKNRITKSKRKFFELGKTKDSKGLILNKTEDLIVESVRKRLPHGKFGILFSGGLDSTVLAYICKKLGRDFICYTAALDEPGMEEAQDLVSAKKVAKELGFKLKVKKLSLEEVRKYLETVVPLIEDNNVVKVGVALTFFAACELAKKDRIKVIFSGLGSEEIFAGYERHKNSLDINKECVSGLLKMYERDLYRDDVITMNNNLELRTPFLDNALIKYALTIPAEYKLDEKRNKIVLRDIAKRMGIPEEFAERKKKAAQYGSKLDRALEKLAHKEGYRKKSEFLFQFYHPPNVKLGVLWSGGKDSAFAAWTMKKQNYELSCLISLRSKNPDSYMFHTPNISLVELHAKAAEIPIIVQETTGEKEKELSDLKKALKRAKKEYKVEGVVTGALFSNYQRERIEKVCDELELKIFSPLWHIDQEKEMRSLLSEGFKIALSSVAALGLDKSWLGRIITEKDVDKLVELNRKYHINVAGEGGEYESLVLHCPLFKRELKITESEIIEEKSHTAKLIVKKAALN